MCVAACVAGERAHLCHFSSSLVVKTTFASGYARTSSSAKNAPGMSVTAWSLLADSQSLRWMQQFHAACLLTCE
jgi:hypothetical protein